jgi:hypothetical protein
MILLIWLSVLLLFAFLIVYVLMVAGIALFPAAVFALRAARKPAEEMQFGKA